MLILLLDGTSFAAKNVILVIGDGMGFNQVAAARIHSGGQNGRLHLDRLPYTAIVNTSSLDSLITDSAACGTAFACGRKTRNGWLAMTPGQSGGDPVRLTTVLEQAKQQGRATGLVTTTTMTHATPASFAAHVEDRGKWDTIAKQYLTATQPDLLLGGGLQYFLPPGEPGSQRSPSTLARQGVDPAEAENDRGLLEMAEKNGYRICLTHKDLASSFHLGQVKVLGLFGLGHLPCEFERPVGTPVPELREMTRFALEFLGQSPRGFFLMVECGRIDHIGHGAWDDFDDDGQRGPDDPEDRQEALRRNVLETLSLDRTVAEILDWMEERDDTLLLVTADHETGGLQLIGPAGEVVSASSLPLVHWATNGHTASNVPAYATGEGASALHGYLDNTDVFHFLARALESQAPSR